jgi:CubicO group peptidase (beta-lactamase class C family)
MHLREWAHNDPTPIALKDALAFGAASRVSRWRPGSRMAYCNSGPAVLAAVIEKVSGQRFEDYVQENFFRPLGMNTASYFLTPEVSRHLTKLYYPDGVTPYPYDHFNYRAASSINASVSDMANLVRFFLQRGSLHGTKLLEPASIERMERTETLAAAKLGDFAGYGLYNNATFNGPFVFRGHGGAICGAMTEMDYLPEYGRGFVVMINSGSPIGIYRIRRMLQRYVIRGLTPPAAPAAASIPVDLQRQYSGYYQPASPPDQWRYGFDRLINLLQLAFSSNGVTTSNFGYQKQRWVPVSDRLLRKDDQPVATLAFLPDTDGELLIQGSWVTFKQVSAWRVWAQLIAIVVISLLIGSVLLFAPVWMFAALFGKFRNAGPLSLRVMPLVTTVLLLAFLLLLASALWGELTVSYMDDYTKLGVPNWFTVSIMLSSAGFALATLASLYVVYRERSAAVNRFLYWHSVMVSVAMAAVSIYFGYWGLIGVRLWT